MSGDLVSVVVANHNHGAFLGGCLESALAQTHRSLEIVVVDDGSTDDSRAILQRYAPRVRVIEQANAGQAAAMNVGVRASTGAFVAFLDADDGWYESKVAESVAALVAIPDVGWLRHKLDLVDGSLAPLAASAPRFRGSAPLPLDPRLVLERVVTAPTSSIVVRRAAIEQIFPLPDTGGFRFDADLLMLARLFERGIRGFSLDRVLGYYRRHGGQRYTNEEDVHRMLSRELEVAAGVARSFGLTDRSAASAKHRTVIAALGGSPAWAPKRVRPLLSGIAASVRLLDRPRLAARQLAALLFAYLAPGRWLRKLQSTMPLAGDVPSKGTE